MRRISHVKLRHLLEEKKSKITDKELFTSRLFRGYLADMAETTGNRYKKPIRVVVDWDESEDAQIACTDNQQIYINAGSELITKLPTRTLKAQCIVGILAHEIGHVLFSDFGGLVAFRETLLEGEFHPDTPEPLNEHEESALDNLLSDTFVSKNQSALTLIMTVASGILNTIEDVYIEARICHKFPGSYKAGINLVNQRLISRMESLQTQIDEGYKPLAIMHNLILEYAKSGNISNPEGIHNEYTEALYRCIPYIDEAVYDDNANVRYTNANLMMLNLWPFIKNAIEKMDEAESNATGGGEEELNELLKQLAEIAEQMSSAPSGKNKPSPKGKSEAPSKEALEASVPMRAKGKVPGSGEKSSSSPSVEVISAVESASEPEPIGTKDEKDDDGDDVGDTIALTPILEESDSESNQIPVEGHVDDDLQDVADHELGRIPLVETDEFDTGNGGGVERNRDYEGSGYSSAAADIERMLESMAQDQVDVALEEELCDDLQALADEIRYGNAHAGIKVCINRIPTVNEHLVESYNAISAPLLLLSKRMQKQVAPILKDRREGGKQTGLLFGKRFNARDAFRDDGRLFYNNRLPSEPMELAVAVLNDESGSMGSYERATVARAASIVLYDFCRGQNIPVAIYGHTTSSYNSDVELFAHAEFESVDNKDKYRLMDISARGSNRDGAALRFTAERLLKRPERLKLLILISDGQPHDGYGYHGTAAEADLRGIKLEYTRKGIKMFAAAIGDDKPNIERIYGDGFLDITDLNKLPLNMCSLLSRHIKAM